MELLQSLWQPETIHALWKLVLMLMRRGRDSTPALVAGSVLLQEDLVGTLEMPLAVGLIGGATKVHPVARLALKILAVNSADELACVIVAVGPAQNFAALKALATTGIQKGHMALHAKNIAMMTDAQGEEVEILVQRLVEQGTIRIDVAVVELAKLRNKRL